jgi:uncharacterized protein YjbJ (UPF0337 family)
MGIADKAKHSAEKFEGKIKEEVGKHTHNRDLEAEGKTDKVSGDLKNAGEKVKDAIKD